MKNEFRSLTTLFVLVAWMWKEGKPLSPELQAKWNTIAAEALKALRFYKIPSVALNKAVVAYAKVLSKFNWNDFQRQVDLMSLAGDEVYSNRQNFENRTEIPNEHIRLLMDALRYWRSENEGAYERVVKNVSVLHDSTVNGLFIREIKGNAKLSPKLEVLVRNLGGTGIDLTQEQKVKAKESNPIKYAEFLALRKELRLEFKQRLMAFFRSKGQKTLDVKAIEEHFKSKGWYYYIPEGFVGKMNEEGRLFTSADLEIDGLPQPGAKIIMNPRYDAQADNAYVFKWYGAKGGSNQVYTIEYRKGRKQVKFQKVGNLAGKIEKIANHWRSKLKQTKSSKERNIAAILELAYLTQGRIGSELGMYEGQKTFGLSTLQAQHFKKQGSKYVIKYPGKKGIIQIHVVDGTSKNPFARRLVAVLDEIIDGKAPHDQVFAWGGKPIVGREVNNYIKRFGFTIHMFRHMRGTVLAKKYLDEAPFASKGAKADKNQVLKYFKESMEKIGHILGHYNRTGVDGTKVTGTTAVKNYVSPSVIKEYFDKAGIRPPATVEKIIRNSTDE